MSPPPITPGTASRIVDAFPVIQAIQFSLADLSYATWKVGGAGQAPVQSGQGRLNGNELAITIGVAAGQVGIATVEPFNWPSVCFPYQSFFLGDYYSFGPGPLPYGVPPMLPDGSYNPVFTTTGMGFTFQSTGFLVRESLSEVHTMDLTKAGANTFYVTLRTSAGQPGAFSSEVQPLGSRAALRKLRSPKLLELALK